MARKIGILFLAMFFWGSLTWAPIHAATNETTATKETQATKETPACPCLSGESVCKCGKDCQCPHCKAGQTPCACKAGAMGCPCKAGDNTCKCGKDCQCPHCKAGQGPCACRGGAMGHPCPSCPGGMTTATEKPVDIPQKPTDASGYAKTMTTKEGKFEVAYTSEPEAMPIGQIISWKLKVQTADGKPVTDAAITVDGDMPEHGHGLPTAPRVTENIGDGTYLVSGIKFSMPGWWIMTFTIKSGDKSDSVTFNLQLK